jgi:dienelactone hydrolase
MNSLLVKVVLAVCLPLTVLSFNAACAEDITLQASDGVSVSATYQGAAKPGRPIILLFHQAGGSGAEFDAIGPRLVQLGFDTLAVDQRSGGPAFGRPNRTVQRLGRTADYLSALPDLQAAVDWAASRRASVIVAWGSSYSASLVLLLAARDKRVTAVVSFSPGEYFTDQSLVRNAASRVTVPVLLSSASTPGEITGARSIFEVLPTQKTKVQLRPRRASHGSIALAEPGGAELWPAVEQFLQSATGASH